MADLVSSGGRRPVDRVLDHQGAHHARRPTAGTGSRVGDYWHLPFDRALDIRRLQFRLLAPWIQFRGALAVNLIVILLILLALGAFGGGFAGWYPHQYGLGGGGLLLLILFIWLLVGR